MHKLKSCDELHFDLIRAFLDYAWGRRQQKRSGSFQLILTTFLMLNVNLKLKCDPKANPKSNKKKKVKSSSLN